jgi:polyhydroxyalkanoate synthesis regulator phasin
MINQKVQDPLKKFQSTKNKEHDKTQKQIKDLTEDFNKNQSETKDTVKRQIYELKMTIQNIKEKLTKIWKTSEDLSFKQKSRK